MFNKFIASTDQNIRSVICTITLTRVIDYLSLSSKLIPNQISWECRGPQNKSVSASNLETNNPIVRYMILRLKQALLHPFYYLISYIFENDKGRNL